MNMLRWWIPNGIDPLILILGDDDKVFQCKAYVLRILIISHILPHDAWYRELECISKVFLAVHIDPFFDCVPLVCVQCVSSDLI